MITPMSAVWWLLKKENGSDIRNIARVFLVLFFSFVIFGLFFMGIFLWNRNIYVSLFIIAVSIIMLISAVYRFWKTYKK